MNKFNKLSFRGKLLVTVALSCLICGVVSVGVAIHYNNVEFNHGLIAKSQIIHGRLNVVAKYVAEQGGLKPMIDRMTQKYKDPSQLTNEDKKVILQQVPIYAAMAIGAENAEKDLYSFRVFSNEPRKKENQATAEEMEIFNKFAKDPELKEWVEKDAQHVTVYRPVRLSENFGCLNCHGDPATSPWGNGQDILGFKMENWKDGKLHGVFAVKNDVAAILKAEADEGGISSTLMLAIFIFFGALLALFIAVMVVNGPLRTLAAISATLSNAGDQVTDASGQIASSSEELSQATTEQASSLEETAASLEQISAMVSKAAENANVTAQSSTDSQRKAEEGRRAVDEMLSSMDEINKSNEAIMHQIDESNQKMAEIVTVIQEIGTKTKVINDIVFQTKLLSFNASVEAARAGEHGKGFAVVAEEVGNLAKMSGNAAKEITDMLEGSISKVDSIVSDTKAKVESLVDQGRRKVEAGVQVAQQCSDVLNEIVQNVSRVSGLAQEISQASREQSQGVGEINKAVSQLDSVTQKNSAASEQTARAAEQLSTQARSMKGAVNDLIRVVQGDHETSIHSHPQSGGHSGGRASGAKVAPTKSRGHGSRSKAA